ncbi:hypothetical protein MBLNU459_g6250t1 [Dothideomycetes sp. NU459]
MDKQPPSSASSSRLPSSSHRLRTVSASEALQNLQARGPRLLSTGINKLDAILGGNDYHPDGPSVAASGGGLERGKVTEIWGPPGAGKTTLAMQVAAGALNNGGVVVWIDACTSLVKTRFQKILAAATRPDVEISKSSRNVRAYFAPTVAHLLAMILHAPAPFPPPNTALLVIDGLNIPFDVAYPRHRPNNYSSKNDAAKWSASRRYSVLGSFMSALKKLAAMNDLAVLVTTGCATRIRQGSGLGAVLVPGLGGGEWEGGVTNRLVVFRDFKSKTCRNPRSSNCQTEESARYIGLQKINGNLLGDDGDIGHLHAFTIDETGLREAETDSAETEAAISGLVVSSPINARKRRHDEIADSDEDEIRDEYGWLEDDAVEAEGLIDEAALVEDDPDVALAPRR